MSPPRPSRATLTTALTAAVAALVLVVTLAAAGCGAGDGTESGAGPSSSAPALPPSPSSPPAEGPGAELPGAELPGGGQQVFPGRRMVALYGHPGNPGLGALGEQPLPEAIARVQQLSAEYEQQVAEPVVPVFEVIATVASESPGPDGDYSVMTPVAQLRPWVDAAAEAGIYVVLDLQPGRADFLTQAQHYQELLAEPHVGLALDPEWRLAPDQVHLAQIGAVDAAEVNQVSSWLAQLTREHQVPQKLLVLHQFRLSMIAERDQLDIGHDELAMLIHADGHGTEHAKLETWQALRADAPPELWWGWKNFYDEDRPTLSPAQTVAVEPSPWFVSYQ